MLSTMQSHIDHSLLKIIKRCFDELLRIILCERSLVATLCRDDIIKELVGQRYIVAIKNGYNTMYVTVSSVCSTNVCLNCQYPIYPISHG